MAGLRAGGHARCTVLTRPDATAAVASRRPSRRSPRTGRPRSSGRESGAERSRAAVTSGPCRMREASLRDTFTRYGLNVRKRCEGPARCLTTVSRVKQQSRDLHASPPAHIAHTRRAAPLGPARAEPSRSATSPTWTACSPTACPSSATTTRRSTALGEVLALAERQYGRSPGGPGGAQAPGCTRSPAGPVCARSPRSAAPVREPRRRPGPPAAPRRDRRDRRAPPRRTRPAGLARGGRHHARAARDRWSWRYGTSSARTRSPRCSPWNRRRPGELLASAACEVERTRAALAVVETRRLPVGGPARPATSRCLLSAVLRRELVRHVDDCPRCRRAAERVEAAGPWPGTRSGSGPSCASAARYARPRPGPRCPAARRGAEGRRATPRWRAPRAAVRARAALRPRRFPDGPQGPRRPPGPAAGAGRDRPPSSRPSSPLRSSRSGRPTGARRRPARAATAPRSARGRTTRRRAAMGFRPTPGLGTGAVENAGNARDRPGCRTSTAARRRRAGRLGRGHQRRPVRVPPARPGADRPRPSLGRPRARAGGTTVITLTAAGATPVSWSARTGAAWLRLSRTLGHARARRVVHLRVLVDHRRTSRPGPGPRGSCCARPDPW